MKSFWEAFKASLWLTVAATFATVTGIASLWSALVPGDYAFGQRWALLFVAAVVIVVGALIEVARQARMSAAVAAAAVQSAETARAQAEDRATHAEAEPRVVAAIKADDETLILVSPAKSFGRDIVAVIYQKDREFELEIGLGRIAHIQAGSDRAQIQIVHKQGKDELWDRICQGDAVLLQTLTARSGLPYHLYQRQDTP